MEDEGEWLLDRRKPERVTYQESIEIEKLQKGILIRLVVLLGLFSAITILSLLAR